MAKKRYTPETIIRNPKPECGGRLRVIACIEEPALIRKILGHVCRREELTGIEARGPPVRGEESLQLM